VPASTNLYARKGFRGWVSRWNQINQALLDAFYFGLSEFEVVLGLIFLRQAVSNRFQVCHGLPRFEFLLLAFEAHES